MHFQIYVLVKIINIDTPKNTLNIDLVALKRTEHKYHNTCRDSRKWWPRFAKHAGTGGWPTYLFTFHILVDSLFILSHQEVLRAAPVQVL